MRERVDKNEEDAAEPLGDGCRRERFGKEELQLIQAVSTDARKNCSSRDR